MNANEVRKFLEEKLHRDVTTAEVAACLKLVDKNRRTNLKEVSKWLSQPCMHLPPVLLPRQLLLRRACLTCLALLIEATGEGKWPDEI
jgi:hypothetical protein